ncbi:MAG: DUF3445 domain-containing protein [Alphaproteobacteria bacterium]|nr:MAG: DUF3445 domain-containing protein [Alphaproteobacteria bacterium]
MAANTPGSARGSAPRPAAPPAALAAAAAELLAFLLDHLATRPGWHVAPDRVRCPDGRVVALGADQPLATAGRLVAEDLCLLLRDEAAGEHRLAAGFLAFPASWTLREKLGRPLGAVHAPVAEYDRTLARRVQRMLDLLRPGRGLWRANALIYADPDLHQPRAEGAPRPPAPPGGRRWLRSERQCLIKLPKSGAIVFSIHTTVVPLERLDADDRAALAARAGPAVT